MNDFSTVETVEGFKGDILVGGNEYDAARAIWNGMIVRSPAAICRCVDASDVAAAVRYAKSRGLKVSVRAGGHGVAGHAIIDGGVVIDLSMMKRIVVDDKRLTVKAEPGLLGEELDRETQKFGYATPMGVVSHTGISGLTLGGGYGWLSRKYGLAADNVVSMEVITADGKHLVVDEDRFPDLFWALRGGGGNYAVVTSFEYKLHRVGPEIFGGLVMYPVSMTKEALKFYKKYVATSPVEATTFLMSFTLPTGVPVVTFAMCYCGDPSEGEKIAAPLLSLGDPVVNALGRMPYTQLQKVFDEGAPHGMNYYWKSGFLQQSSLSETFIDVFVENVQRISSPYSMVAIEQLGGVINKRSISDTAYTHRDVGFNLVISSAWKDRGEDERHIDYTKGFWRALKPFFAGGIYQNYENADDTRLDNLYSVNAGPLAEIKAKYDPEHLFVGNGYFK